MANDENMTVTKVRMLGKVKTKLEKEIKNLESDPEWDKTEYGKRTRKRIILEKKAIIDAIDHYVDYFVRKKDKNE